ARSMETMELSSSTSSTFSPRRSTTRVVEEDERLSAGDDGLERAVDRRVDDRPHEVAQPLHRELRCHLFLVRPRGGEGIVDLDGADDPRAQRDRIANQAIGVPAPVPPLV